MIAEGYKFVMWLDSKISVKWLH